MEFSFDSDIGSVGKVFSGTLVLNSLINLCNVGEFSFETCFFAFLLDSLLVGLPTRFFWDVSLNIEKSLNNAGGIFIGSVVFGLPGVLSTVVFTSFLQSGLGHIECFFRYNRDDIYDRR